MVEQDKFLIFDDIRTCIIHGSANNRIHAVTPGLLLTFCGKILRPRGCTIFPISISERTVTAGSSRKTVHFHIPGLAC